MSQAAEPGAFQFYIQNPDGTLTLQYGLPPAGYVDISQPALPMATSMVASGGYSYGAFPQATSMVATPLPMEYTTTAPAATTVEAAPAAKKKKSSKKKKSGCC
eukprot:CAMPEP_0197620420 /NCGR_PEP_ID=MMETSP1338-20131121/1247_1 /TAXON_ID=43686 ORGANISM="Pelagodinium beii, Strain RCC1491" /NCGR_SAMPLE_ID=MMETSP1338 /ASSEMBLY_ACC=CAM_ASM_000754 /LENGTH=102 /DNA_ID=CAMNT_0043189597 /DNA_START=44 /DNA_END=352 /DNA_ORIENTATION=+